MDAPRIPARLPDRLELHAHGQRIFQRITCYPSTEATPITRLTNSSAGLKIRSQACGFVLQAV